MKNHWINRPLSPAVMSVCDSNWYFIVKDANFNLSFGSVERSIKGILDYLYQELWSLGICSETSDHIWQESCDKICINEASRFMIIKKWKVLPSVITVCGCYVSLFSISGGFINDICYTNYYIILYLDHHLISLTVTVKFLGASHNTVSTVMIFFFPP